MPKSVCCKMPQVRISFYFFTNFNTLVIDVFVRKRKLTVDGNIRRK